MNKLKSRTLKLFRAGWLTMFIISILLPLNGFAQEIEVKGVVKDAAGQPVPGASIMVKGTMNGVAAGIDGEYSIMVNKTAVLTFSAIGFQPAEESVNNRAVINVVLQEDVNLLDDVVVVGYGTQKKASVTGSVAVVKGDVLKKANNANLSNSFAGRMPGVIATNRSGEPGADWSDILIRGKGTLDKDKMNTNAPLFVIDGVANRSGMERLNPSDIESISVLKDASAAIYGAQAANGVILITTKRGTNSKPVVEYNGSVSMAQHTRTPNLVNAYNYMVYEDERSIRNGQTPVFELIKGGYLDGTIDKMQYGDTDWMNVVFSKFAPQTRHSLSVRGGNENVKYYISGDYSWQQPNYKNTVFDFSTAQIRANIDAKINRDLSIGLELAGRSEDRNNSIYSTGTMMWETFCTYPYLYDYYPNGLPGPGVSWGNNLAILAQGRETGYDRINDLFANTKVSFNLDMPWVTKGLSVFGYAAFDYHINNRKQFWDMWDTYNYDSKTGEYIKQTTNADYNINLNQWHDKNLSTTLHFRVAYDREFGDHRVSAFAAYEQSKNNGENFWGWRGYYLSNKLDYLAFGAEKERTNGGNGYVSARQNLFGRLNYSYKNRYLVEFTMRYDGSMNFAKSGRWGTFPGVSAGWRISEENFMKNVKWVNELKLRASWGKLGNDRVFPFQYLSTYQMGDGAILGDKFEKGKGFAPGRIGNPGMTWEKVDTKNIGIETTLLNNMLDFSAEYFFQNRKDILTPKQASIPKYTGLTLPDQNIGEINNQGIELSINHSNTVGDIRYYIGGNFTYTKNKIVFFDEAANIPEWQKRTGYSIDSWLMYKTDGIYNTWDEINSTPHLEGTKPGDIKYLDIDGDEAITQKDRVRDYSSNVPQIVYGINLGLEWKGLGFNMLWTGQAKATQMIVPYGFVPQQEFFDGRWISAEKTPNAKYPAAFNYKDTYNTEWSDFWLYDASFIRLKNVEVSYTFPEKILKKIGMQNLRVYLTGNNLFTIDNIKFQDPESNATSAGQYYPQQRTYSFGINLSF